MPHDPTGRYKGNRFDPDYAAKRRLRQQWQGNSRPSPSRPYQGGSPSSYSVASSMDRYSNAGFGSGGGGNEGNNYDDNTRGDFDSPSPSFHNRPHRYDNGGYSDNSGHHQDSSQEGGRQDVFMEPTSTTDPSAPLTLGSNKGDNPTLPSELSLSAILANTNANNNNDMAPAQGSPAALSLSTPSVSAPGGGELSSLEKLKLFKAQVEATRRRSGQSSQQEQQQQEQQRAASAQQVDSARAAETFLLNFSAVSTPLTPSNESQIALLQEASSSVPNALLPTNTPPARPQSENAYSTTGNNQDFTQQPGTPQHGEEAGGAAENRDARAHALKEKLRLKLAQKAAHSNHGSANGTPAPPAPASAFDTPPPSSIKTENPPLDQPAERRPQEDVHMEDATLNGKTNASTTQPAPTQEGSVQPENRAENRLQERVEPQNDEPPRGSYAEAARQRFAARADVQRERDQRIVERERAPPADRPQKSDNRYDSRYDNRYEVSRPRSASPGRRAPSPRRASSVREPSPRPAPRRPSPSPARYERTERPTTGPEYHPDRQRMLERRASVSSVDRRGYERAPPAEAYPATYIDRREREQDAAAMPPPGHRAPYAEPPRVAPPARDNGVPAVASEVEDWALNQIELLKQQNAGIERQISEMEKLLRSGVLRPSAQTPAPPPPAPASVASSAPAPRRDYRQDPAPAPRSEYRSDPRPEPRQEPRIERSLDHRLERRPSYSEHHRPASVREPSPALASSRGFSPLRFEERPTGPPYGQKEYDYGASRGPASGDYRSTPGKDYGKAPTHKYNNARMDKPYSKPYDRRPSYDNNASHPRDRSPGPSRYASSSNTAPIPGNRYLERRGSWDSRAPPKDTSHRPY